MALTTMDLKREVLAREAKIASLRKHLSEMIETVQWMSGSADFGTDGQAHKGWIKAREKLNAAMAVAAS